jgi:hypothetical protein
MERVKRFTRRDVFANTYTIINNKLVITHTKSFNEYWGDSMERMYKFITGDLNHNEIWGKLS